MGAILFIGTPWMRNEGVLKKIVWAMCNCMVSMATHSEFEKGGGSAYKITHISAVTYSRLLNLITNKSLDIDLLSPSCICKLSNLHIHKYL